QGPRDNRNAVWKRYASTSLTICGATATRPGGSLPLIRTSVGGMASELFLSDQLPRLKEAQDRR
ncbi:MAG: hypothetical protein P4M11_00915, partial [Candidatus Pacebacteria bacterium]|nr:hypothetical protein [Candidatus Paceibacterota bacterium]